MANRKASLVNLLVGGIFAIASIVYTVSLWNAPRSVPFLIDENSIRSRAVEAIKGDLVSMVESASRFDFNTQTMLAGMILLGIVLPIFHLITTWGGKEECAHWKKADLLYSVIVVILGISAGLSAFLCSAWNSAAILELSNNPFAGGLNGAVVTGIVEQANHMIVRGIIAIKGICIALAFHALFALYIYPQIRAYEKALTALD